MAARHLSALRNQRSRCSLTRFFERPGAGKATLWTPSFFRLPLIVRREESPVGGGHLGRLSEMLRVFVERRHPLRLVGGIAICDVVVANDAVFNLINTDQSSKLRRLGRLPFADHGCMFFKNAHDFLGMVTLTVKNARLRLL